VTDLNRLQADVERLRQEFQQRAIELRNLRNCDASSPTSTPPAQRRRLQPNDDAVNAAQKAHDRHSSPGGSPSGYSKRSWTSERPTGKPLDLARNDHPLGDHHRGLAVVLVSTAEVLDRIRDALLSEAVQSLNWADQYRVSKKQGERNSVPVYVRRGEAALAALELVDGAFCAITEGSSSAGSQIATYANAKRPR
jgi:hypothetical protein